LHLTIESFLEIFGYGHRKEICISTCIFRKAFQDFIEYVCQCFGKHYCMIRASSMIILFFEHHLDLEFEKILDFLIRKI
jgi:hypothetical protein